MLVLPYHGDKRAEKCGDIEWTELDESSATATIVLFSRNREAAIWCVGLFPEGFGRGLADSESVL